MNIIMDDSQIQTLPQIQKLLSSSKNLVFRGVSRRERYAWVGRTLKRFRYSTLRKPDKGLLRTYLQRLSGFSRAQTTRLVARCLTLGTLTFRSSRRHRFPATYTTADRRLLAETDNAHQRLSGPATRRIFQRQYDLYGDVRFVRLKNISSAHIYNLRASPDYQRSAQTFASTHPVRVSIGIRRRPDPQGRPGWIRVDTVHQGDLDHQKGVYHINLVDPVTQWEIVVCVEKISERYLLPALQDALALFPFVIHGFHSDNGSEFINTIVAKLLNKLLIEQTKSRAGRTNDNALVEGKNGSVIRKHMGYGHIEARHAASINAFYLAHFIPYLNFHRPCAFPTVTVDAKGKRHRSYETWQTPYERFRSLPHPAPYLRPDESLDRLAREAARLSDNEAAQLMQHAKDRLFRDFHLFRRPPRPRTPAANPLILRTSHRPGGVPAGHAPRSNRSS